MRDQRATRRHKGYPVTTGSIALTAFAVFGPSAPPAAAQTVEDLRQQLDMLQRRIEQLETRSRKKTGEIERKLERADRKLEQADKKLKKADIRPPPPDGWFRVPGTETMIKFGGWARGDVQANFGADPGDTFSTANLPFEENPDGTPVPSTDRVDQLTRLTARNTRFNFTSVTPTWLGPVRGFLEFDFRGVRGSEVFTNSEGPRLRHAMVEFPVSENGRALVGQFWSVAFAVSPYGPLMAPTVAWVSSEGGLFARQAQVRYTHNFGDYRLLFSLESPELRISDQEQGTRTVQAAGLIPTDASGNAGNDTIPDFLMAVDYKAPFGQYGRVGMINQFLNIDAGGIDETQWGWGVYWQHAVPLPFANHTFFAHLAYGDGGLGRYLNGSFFSGHLVGDEIETAEQWGFRLGYQYVLNKNLQFNFVGGLERNNLPSEFTGSRVGVNRTLWSAHANVMAKPFDAVPNLTLGLEYMVGEREEQDGVLPDGAGRDVTVQQLAFMTRYNF